MKYNTRTRTVFFDDICERCRTRGRTLVEREQVSPWYQGDRQGGIRTVPCLAGYGRAYGCRRTSKKLLFALELVLPASSFLIPYTSGINP